MTENPLLKKLERLSEFEGIFGLETIAAGLVIALLDPVLVPGGIALIVTGGGILARSVQLQIRANRLDDTPQQRKPITETTTTGPQYWEDADDGDFSEADADVAMLRATRVFLNKLNPPDA